MTVDYAVIIAPAWATCEVCGCPAGGDLVEVAYLADEQPHYTHADLVKCLERWEASAAPRAAGERA